MIRHEVVTTEKVPFSYRVAGMGSRFLAWLVDIGLMFLCIFIGSCLATVVEAGRAGLGSGVFLAALFAVQFGYYLFFEWLWHGQTPGKHLVGIRVVNWEGTSISFMQSAIRNLLRGVDGFPPVFPLLYALGFVVAACTREHRRLGDLAAGTLVVHSERRSKPVQAVHESSSEADRAWRMQVRQRLNQLDRDQKQTILDLCLRRDQLRVADRARLFHATAQFFQERMGLSPAQYQSDEKFVVALAVEIGRREADPAESVALLT